MYYIILGRYGVLYWPGLSWFIILACIVIVYYISLARYGVLYLPGSLRCMLFLDCYGVLY